MKKGPWNRCKDQLPPLDTPVDTKIDDAQGVRNEQPLLLTETPRGLTHWRHLAEPVCVGERGE